MTGWGSLRKGLIVRIYLYQEYCTGKGQVFDNEEASEMTDDEKDDFNDVFLFGDGSEEELVSQAQEDLRTVFDHRAGGAGDAFRWRCARQVLAHFGVSEGTD